MDKRTALKLDSFLSLAIQCFLSDFKREKDKYNLTLAWNALFTYLHVNKSSTIAASPKFIKGSYYRIAIAGLKYAGKTAILQRLLTGEFVSNTKPTQGAECELFSRGSAKFQVTDLGGQETFIQSLWQSFMLKANAMVYVVDTSDEDTLSKSRDTLNLAVSWNSEVKVLLVLANKQDIEGSMDKETLTEYLDLDNLVAGTGIESYIIIDTSARTGLNIEDSFNWLAGQLTGQETLQSVNILSVYVFKKTGQPIAAGHGPTAELAQVNMMSPKEDFMMISGVYSAIGAFVSQVFKGQIVTVEIKGSHGKTYKLVNVEKDNYLCLLLVDGKDDLVIIEAIGKVLIDYVTKMQKTEDDISASRIRSIIRPFYGGMATNGAEEMINGNELTFTDDNVLVVSDYHKSKGKSLKEEGRIESEFFSTLSVMDHIRLQRDELKKKNGINQIGYS